MIAIERRRQISVEGWSSKHDDAHDNGQLADAAAVYAMSPSYRAFPTDEVGNTIRTCLWPWDDAWFKPYGGRIRQLAKAGALIAAEIDRLKRVSYRRRIHSTKPPKGK